MTEILGEEGAVKLLMGNEAISRGAIEAGATLVTGYPGTPSTEVIETLIPVAKKAGIRVEWSVNEKVALEVAAGAAFAGMRSMVTMKNAGLNVASDPLLSIAYSGVDGGFVIYVADDPAAHSGMAEQDDRLHTKLSLLPMIEPSDPQEAKDMVVKAFELSEEIKTPILLRTTTRTAHMFGNVGLGPLHRIERVPSFVRDIRRYTKASPAWCMEQHASLNHRLEEAGRSAGRLNFNRLEGAKERGKVGVIASGAAWNYLKEVVIKHGLEDIPTLKVGMVNPLPDDLINELLTKIDAVLILEELEPYIELHVMAMLGKLGKRVKVYGKLDGTTPRIGEFDQAIVERALVKVLGKRLFTTSPERERAVEEAKKLAIRRPLTFCAGCPHAATYIAILKAIKKLGYKKDDVIVTGDIGCTILGMNPPFDVCWTEISMGASIGVAYGLKRAGVKKPVIAAIGDSTFYHAGIPPLINAAWGDMGIIVAILDNGVTAMTGHQPAPSSGYTAMEKTSKVIKAEDIAKACGIENVVVVDPYELEKATEAFVTAIQRKGPSVIVLRRLCAIEARRRGLIENPLRVDPEKCTGCLTCIKTTACSALHPNEKRKVEIDPEVCNGCGVCANVCPTDAIGLGGCTNG